MQLAELSTRLNAQFSIQVRERLVEKKHLRTTHNGATDGYALAMLSVVGFTDTQIQEMLKVADVTIEEMTDAATILGTAKSRIDLQKTFTTSLMDSIERGVGQLVDADMNKESTRLQALQVQQQLGIQSLSIANSNAQSILSLFRNG